MDMRMALVRLIVVSILILIDIGLYTLHSPTYGLWFFGLVGGYIFMSWAVVRYIKGPDLYDWSATGKYRRKDVN